MDETILNTIYAIVGVSLLISWIIVVVQIVKIKIKLYDKSNLQDMMYEGEIAELAGDKTEALKWYYKALFWHWNDRYEFAKIDNKLDELVKELKSLYGDKIKKCDGPWPDRIKK